MRILVTSFLIGTVISLTGQRIGLSQLEILALCAIAGGTLGVWEATRNGRNS